MKKLIPIALLLSVVAAFFILENPKRSSKKIIANVDVSPGIATKSDRFARFNYLRKQLVDPATGEIPPFMRQKELMFTKAMAPASKAMGSFDMDSRGPYNVGGRTRAFAIDIDDENIMLAGSVSGGVWKSIDAGANWYRVSSPTQNLSVTTLVQDPRAGHHDEWYYGTGELFGASQSGPGAFYLGNGIYKSTDNGETWTSLAATASNSPQSFNTPWEGIWRIAIDPSNMAQTEIYAATYTRVYRSTNGGTSWTQAQSPPNLNNIAYFSDVSVTSTGVVYTAMSRENQIIGNGISSVGGIWRSTDGMTFTSILPPSFPPTFNRIVMGINPSDEDEIYFLASNVDTSYGKECNTIMQSTSWNALWKYNYISGNGSGAGGMWTDLSQNLYTGPDDYDDFNPQSGYNLCIAVSPADPNIVIVGGTNLYRSTNGFATSDSVEIIGGFKKGMQWPIFEDYPGHHSDQHGVCFLPSDPNVLFSFNDGGIGRTDNVMDTNVTWASLENGYLTSQFYNVAIDLNDTSDAIVGGLQDNGNFYTSTAVDTDPWIRPHNGDGGPSYFAKNNDFLMLSVQLGVLLKVQIDSMGNELGYERVDPDLNRDLFEFIHPYALDPNDDDCLYLPVGRKLWIKNDLTSVSLNNGYTPSFAGWVSLNDSLTGSRYFTAIATTTEVQKKIYLGTNNEKIYRVDDASNPNSPLVDITDTQFPNSYIKSIAVDPMNSDKIMIAFSNYSVYSIWYSEDGGTNWQKAAGNLEQTSGGSGNGPSVRAVSILPLQNGKTMYLAGTSTGLFMTDTIQGHSTAWLQISPGDISTNIVTDIKSRPQDELIVVATHGNGIYSGTYDGTLVGISEAGNDISDIQLYPNPTKDQINIEFEIIKKRGNYRMIIYDELGRTIENGNKSVTYTSGKQKVSVDISNYSNGTHYVELHSATSRAAVSFIKQ